MGKITVRIIYFDGMILTGDNPKESSKLKAQLATSFEIKDLGGLMYFLEIEVAWSN